MFQSGHTTYAQDTASPHGYGEDNWRYAAADYARRPTKPVVDGEPSYEAIPHGLHDTTQPYWTADDVRRYAWWSVLAGSMGHTYGHNAVMQFYRPGDQASFGPKKRWQEAIQDPGAGQMRYVKQLMLSRSYFSRVPDDSLISGAKRHALRVRSRGARRRLRLCLQLTTAGRSKSDWACLPARGFGRRGTARATGRRRRSASSPTRAGAALCLQARRGRATIGCWCWTPCLLLDPQPGVAVINQQHAVAKTGEAQQAVDGEAVIAAGLGEVHGHPPRRVPVPPGPRRGCSRRRYGGRRPRPSRPAIDNRAPGGFRSASSAASCREMTV